MHNEGLPILACQVSIPSTERKAPNTGMVDGSADYLSASSVVTITYLWQGRVLRRRYRHRPRYILLGQ